MSSEEYKYSFAKIFHLSKTKVRKIRLDFQPMEEKAKMFFYVDGDKVAGRGFKEATNKTGFQRGRSPPCV